jgi:hypothetical protein
MGPAPLSRNGLQCGCRVWQALDVYGDNVSTSLCVGDSCLFWLINHHVDFDRHAGRTPDRLNHDHAVSQLGDKTPIHDIEMDAAGAGGLKVSNFVGQMAKVAKQ